MSLLNISSCDVIISVFVPETGNGQRPDVRLSRARLHLQTDGRNEEKDSIGKLFNDVTEMFLRRRSIRLKVLSFESGDQKAKFHMRILRPTDLYLQ